MSESLQIHYRKLTGYKYEITRDYTEQIDLEGLAIESAITSVVGSTDDDDGGTGLETLAVGCLDFDWNVLPLEILRANVGVSHCCCHTLMP